jgi:UDP-3-O-[3-hydroxymyristoyl] glucosamine N-acyltransferase
MGRWCTIAADSGFIGHLIIADDVVRVARRAFTRAISEAATCGGALPGDEPWRWQENAARFRSLDERMRGLASLQRSFDKWRRGATGEGDQDG